MAVLSIFLSPLYLTLSHSISLYLTLSHSISLMMLVKRASLMINSFLSLRQNPRKMYGVHYEKQICLIESMQ